MIANELYFIYDTKGIKKEIKIPIIPQSISYSYNPNFVSQQVLGRVSPIYRYINGSEEIYNFSVTLHQDMLFNKTLTELVDEIKMMSYPIYKKGIQEYPEIYFELGDISANVVVDSSISWKKPITSGHYVLVDIGFAIRVIKKYEKLEEQIIRDTESSLGANDRFIYSGFSDQESQEIQDFLKTKGYDTYIHDFVIQGYNSAYRDILRNEAERTFNKQAQRLEELYGFMANTEFKHEEFKTTLEVEMGWMQAADFVITDAGAAIKVDGKITQLDKKGLEQLRKSIKKYLDKHYEETMITHKEKEIILEGIYSILEKLKDLGEEVVGYAAYS